MFKIFKPFESVTRNSNIFICTWGLTEYSNLYKTNKLVERAATKKLLVGYSKESHNCKDLKIRIQEYIRNGWSVKVLPSFHAKIWIIDNNAWVGSCNWAPDSIHNYMHKTIKTPRLNRFIQEFWSKGYNITHSSKLWLLPQK